MLLRGFRDPNEPSRLYRLSVRHQNVGSEPDKLRGQDLRRYVLLSKILEDVSARGFVADEHQGLLL